MQERHKRKVLEFLRCQKLAVIATASPVRPAPESALIAYAEDDELCLYFQTGVHTRKAANLKRNPAVSLVIGLSLETLITLQYEGRAEQIVDPAGLEACKQRFIAKDSPTTEEYFNHPTAIFFKVVPTWIGCSDYSGKTPEVIELKDF
ncbi:MAG TPA: pyridoxamine 5'-phosphate oxidase family protein [Candidatus Pristimantibacillus sp.]|nr:pyridoxamine 5'-phosphate oxidase family protein [Candidatus Pristimantibacillus sp.]